MATCLFRLSELNWVSTKIWRRPAVRQLLIGMSIRRYLPPIGTAGFDRLSVSGNSRVPRPPPRMIATTSSIAIAGDLYQKPVGGAPGASINRASDVRRCLAPRRQGEAMGARVTRQSVVVTFAVFAS